MSEHTPGPWSVVLTRGPANEPLFHKIIADGQTLASTWAEPHEANARLMGAAPDLLAACKHALMIALEYDETGFAGTIALKDMLRAAITKATTP